jgi:subtilisin family serine protease
MNHPSLGKLATAAVLLIALFAWGCAATPAGRGERQPVDLPKQLRAGQIIVTLADDTPERWARTAADLSAAYQLREVGNFPLSSIRVQCLVYEVSPDRPQADIVQQLKNDPRVESVQSNQVFEGVRGAHNDAYASMEYGAAAIRAERAHRLSTGKGVKVAIVDTGVNKDHPDLRGRVAKTVNFVEGGETSFGRDLHGTAVAGIIGARADDGIGIFGVAPESELSVAKACWYSLDKKRTALCSSWTLAKAVDFAINAEAQVINMSLGGPPDALLERLINAAQTRNMIVIAAAAQEGTEPGFPASLPAVIAVVASDAKGSVQPPGWAKDSLLLAAPGVDVLTTASGDGYDFLSGSSLAAAHVSGVAALLLERNPRLSPARLWELLTQTAHPVMTPTRALSPPIAIIDACAAIGKMLGQDDC